MNKYINTNVYNKYLSRITHLKIENIKKTEDSEKEIKPVCQEVLSKNEQNRKQYITRLQNVITRYILKTVCDWHGNRHTD
jgi:hypothetical protein